MNAPSARNGALSGQSGSETRLALVSRYPPRGQIHSGRGLAAYSRQLAVELARAGLHVTVVADRLNGYRDEYEEQGVSVERVWRYGSHALGDITRALRQTPVDLVHLQHELFMFGPRSAAIIPALLLHALGSHAPIVTTVHGVLPTTAFQSSFVGAYAGWIPPRLAREAYRRVLRSLVRQSGLVIVHSDAILQSLHEYVRPRLAVVIPPGVSFPVGRPAKAEALSTLGLRDAPRALFFGFQLPYKGLEILETAAPTLADRGVEVIIAGGNSGDPRPTARPRGRAKPASNIRRLGYVPEEWIPSLFAAADVLVLPYTVGLSASAVIALAVEFETPVVASDLPTFKELIPFESRFPSGNSEALASTIFRVLNDEETRRANLAALRELATSSSWANIADRTLDAYAAFRRS